MSTQRNGFSKHQQSQKFSGDGTNWILIAGGALLSTLSIRFGYKLKQSNDSKSHSNGTGNGTSYKGCCLRSNAYSYERNNDCCFHCNQGTENIEGNKATAEQMVVPSPALPLVTVTVPSFSNEVMWPSSPDHLKVSTKPYNHHHSACSDSPCVSESGSDIFSKREVIQKLRQQLKRRDDMILEMQEQILDLQNSQISHSSLLQAQIDAKNRDLFESEREVQRLRKVISDHCIGHAEVNGFMESSPVEKDAERIEKLKKEVSELREVIDGKEYLVRSYKEEKIELLEKIKEMQQRLDSKLPNIL